MDAVPISGSWRGWASGSNKYLASNVGIGTTIASELLDIEGGSGGGHIELNNPDSGGNAFVIGVTDTAETSYGAAGSLFIRDGGSSRFVLTSAGRVGIGTATPSETLHVEGDALVTGMLTAREFHTQFVSASIIYKSGSTQFGDTTDDMHSFTGS